MSLPPLGPYEAGHRNGFAGMFTGRSHPKRVAEALADRGLLERVELQPADGDGCILWGRAPRQGYALTPAGRSALEHEHAALDAAAPPKAGEP